MAEKHNKRHERTDPTPLKPHVSRLKQQSVDQRIRAAIMSDRMEQIALAQGFESFEEADDFDIEDDMPDPNTPYEKEFEGSIVKDAAERLIKNLPPSVTVGEKTFSGKTAKELVDYLKTAPQAAIDKLLGRSIKDGDPPGS